MTTPLPYQVEILKAIASRGEDGDMTLSSITFSTGIEGMTLASGIEQLLGMNCIGQRGGDGPDARYFLTMKGKGYVKVANNPKGAEPSKNESGKKQPTPAQENEDAEGDDSDLACRKCGHKCRTPAAKEKHEHKCKGRGEICPDCGGSFASVKKHKGHGGCKPKMESKDDCAVRDGSQQITPTNPPPGSTISTSGQVQEQWSSTDGKSMLKSKMEGFADHLEKEYNLSDIIRKNAEEIELEADKRGFTIRRTVIVESKGKTLDEISLNINLRKEPIRSMEATKA